MKVYVRFCSCQLTAASTLQDLQENNAEFRDVSRKCQSDPRTKGLPLSSFLIKPMQRITKYPLLIKKVKQQNFLLIGQSETTNNIVYAKELNFCLSSGKVLHYTSEDHPDYSYVLEAQVKAEELCSQVSLLHFQYSYQPLERKLFKLIILSGK